MAEGVKIWELPSRLLDPEDRVPVGRAGADSASVKLTDAVERVVFLSEETALPNSAARVVTIENGELRRRTPATVAGSMPLAGTAPRGLVTPEDKAKIDSIPTGWAAPVPYTGGQPGLVPSPPTNPPQATQFLAATGQWLTPAGGGGGGGGGGTPTVSNVGAGAGVYQSTVSDVIRLRSLTGAGPVSASVSGDTVQVAVAEATPAAAGLLPAADKQKINAIPSGWTPPTVYSGTGSGLVPPAPANPPPTNQYLSADGQWRTPAGGGSTNLGEPPATPTGQDPVPYGRAFVGGVGGWYRVPALGHSHSLLDLSQVTLDGAPTPATVHWDGSALAWRQPYNTRELADVATTTPVDGDILVWSGSTQRYVPTARTASEATIDKGTPLVGPAVVTLTTASMGKVTKVDLSAGDVEVQVPTGLSHPAGTVMYGQWQIGPNVLSGAKLRFRSQEVQGTTPSVIANYLGGKGSNSSSTAISSWSPEGSDKHILTIPAASNVVLLIGVGTHTATLGTAPTITMTLDGTSITPTTFTGADYGLSAGGWRYYTQIIGNVASPITRTLRVTGGTNYCLYSVIMVALSDAHQTTPFIDIQHQYVPAALATVTYTGNASETTARRLYFCNRINSSGSTAPTTAGATQLAWTNINTGANRGAGTLVLASEEVTAPGTIDCQVTWAAALNSAAMMVTVKSLAVPGVAMRVAGNVLPDIGVPNELVTLVYDGSAGVAGEALVVF